jgi:hypothetical protein
MKFVESTPRPAIDSQSSLILSTTLEYNPDFLAVLIFKWRIRDSFYIHGHSKGYAYTYLEYE